MNYQLIISPEVEFEIEDAFKWYEESSSGLGSEFVRAVDGCLALIGRNPNILNTHESKRTTLVAQASHFQTNPICH